MKALKGFDPLIFLDIVPAEKDVHRISFELLSQISEFLVIRTIELIPESETTHIETVQELFKYAEETVPDYDAKVKGFLQDFKERYQSKL